MKTEKQQGHMADMTRGGSFRVIIRFALPLVAAAVIQQLFSPTGAMVLGIFGGNRGLAVLGVCSQPAWFQVGVSTNFGQASCLLTTARFGAKNGMNLKKAIGNVYFASFPLGLVMVSGLLGSVGTLLRIQNTPPEVSDDASSYLRILYIGTVFLLVYNTLSSLLRALGDGYTSFLAITVSALVNAVMDVVLATGSGMGVRGAATTTTASQVLVVLIYLVKISHYPVFRIRRKHLRPDDLPLKEYIGICISIIAQSIVVAVGGTFIQSHINQYGTVLAADTSAAGKILSVVETGAVALASASASFISQNVGIGQFERIRTVAKQVCRLSEVTAVAMATVLLFFGRYILSFYVTDETVVHAVGNLKVYSAGLLLVYPMYALRQMVQALGNVKIPLLAAVLQLVMKILIASFLPILIRSFGIYFTSFAAWVVSLILIGFVYPVQFRKCMENSRGGEIP